MGQFGAILRFEKLRSNYGLDLTETKHDFSNNYEVRVLPHIYVVNSPLLYIEDTDL